jgi:hypothetical protein
MQLSGSASLGRAPAPVAASAVRSRASDPWWTDTIAAAPARTAIAATRYEAIPVSDERVSAPSSGAASGSEIQVSIEYLRKATR